jgi:hypothetical protein
MTARSLPPLAAVLLGAALAGRATAQSSPFGINGLGVPGRFESARARATAGAFAPFDPLSALTDASIVGLTQVTASASGGTSYLTDEIGGERATRRTTRFPVWQLAGPAWSKVTLGAGVTTYLDRTYRVVVQDTITLGGARQAVTDVLSGDGGVTDLRFVAGRRFGSIDVGIGFHLLGGSSRFDVRRDFADTSSYGTVEQTGEVAYRGSGYSASIIVRLGPALRVAAYGRTDTRLSTEQHTISVAKNDLPTTLGGAVQWQPSPEATVGASLTRQSWADAADSGAFNTTNWSVGAQLGTARLPLRFGVRGGQLPFGPGLTAPREFAVAVGSGIQLSEGRGVIDLTLERLRRTGGGLTETAWTVLVGLTVRP